MSINEFSGMQTLIKTDDKELQDLANSHDCKLLRLPRLFEVRWTEFTFSPINSVLVSWHALALYMQKSTEKECKGFLSFLLNEDNLRLLSFLADVLTLFTRYQKELQGDNLTILDMDKAELGSN